MSAFFFAVRFHRYFMEILRLVTIRQYPLADLSAVKRTCAAGRRLTTVGLKQSSFPRKLGHVETQRSN